MPELGYRIYFMLTFWFGKGFFQVLFLFSLMEIIVVV